MIARDELEKLATWEPDQYRFDAALTGVQDFIMAVFADPTLLERMPKGGTEETRVVFVGEGVPPVDLAAYAGKTVYVHRLSPEASAELLARHGAAVD